jgi:hypothetical protein
MMLQWLECMPNRDTLPGMENMNAQVVLPIEDSD